MAHCTGTSRVGGLVTCCLSLSPLSSLSLSSLSLNPTAEKVQFQEEEEWRKEDRPAQSLEPSWGRASRLRWCSGSAATEQDLCKTVIATSRVNWVTTLDCLLKQVQFQEEEERRKEEEQARQQRDRYSSQFENNYFTEMCSGSKAGSYLRRIDFIYHSTLGLRVIKKNRRRRSRPASSATGTSLLFLLYSRYRS